MKQYNVIIDDKTHTGTPRELVEKFMDEGRFTKYNSIEEYLKEIPKTIWRLYNVSIDIGSGTLDERCDKFLQQIISNDLIKVAK